MIWYERVRICPSGPEIVMPTSDFWSLVTPFVADLDREDPLFAFKLGAYYGMAGQDVRLAPFDMGSADWYEFQHGHAWGVRFGPEGDNG